MAASALNEDQYGEGSHAEHILEVKDLHIHYGKICALENVSFSVSCGHCVGLLGQNGAGKSTMLKSIAGLIKKDVSGSITWRGKPLKEVRKEIAYLPQSSTTDPLFPITVRGLVELGRYPHVEKRGKWKSEDSEIVEEALTTLKLNDLADRRIHQLSGGQLQRAQIARALAQQAHVLLLDEPYSGLDEPSQEKLGKLLKELAQSGHLLIVCHHDLKSVPELFDHVLLLNREAVAFGPTEETFTEENLNKSFTQLTGAKHV